MSLDNLHNIVLQYSTTAIAVVNHRHHICYHNERFGQLHRSVKGSSFFQSLIGRDFYQVLGDPKIFSGDFAPLYHIFDKWTNTNSILVSKSQVDGNERWFEMTVSRLEYDGELYSLVELRDHDRAFNVEQRYQTLQNAGRELTAFTPRAANEEWKEYLKSSILGQLCGTLQYNVFEIRLFDKSTGELIPFLSSSMDKDAKERKLFARYGGNGITGYVAISRNYYICDDTENDAHYVRGAIDAKSSLTVPMMLADELVGVCNIESEKPHAFTDQDAIFLLLYAKDLALAIHLLQFMFDKELEIKERGRKQLYNSLEAVSNSIFSRALRCCDSTKGENDQLLLQEVDVLRERLSSMERPLNSIQQNVGVQEKRLENNHLNNDNQIGDVFSQKNEKSRSLREFRVLVVGELTQGFLNALNAYFFRVDVVTSTVSALKALRLFHYDIVISTQNPDGCYLQGEADLDTRNSFGLSVYDIHYDGYFEPVEGNENDAKERNRIKREIESGKLDAYFFYCEMCKIGLETPPFFVLAVRDGYHDKSHIQVALANYNDSIPPVMVFSNCENINILLDKIIARNGGKI